VKSKVNARTLKEWKEYKEIADLLRGFRSARLSSRRQLNALFEADCEILKLSSKKFLCLSADSIGEEIDQGLYRDPFTWGWMTAMSSVSDLAASGARPLGLLLANQWAYGTTRSQQKKFFQGLKAALSTSNTPLLGGDSGVGKSHAHTSTILGEASAMPLTRLGVKAGDYVAIIGKNGLGDGPALAWRFLFKLPTKEFSEQMFRPRPPIEITHRCRPLLNAAMDTSDGLATSLATIGLLNSVGFDLKPEMAIFSKSSLRFAKRHGVHPLTLIMGNLGDLQTLVFFKPSQLKPLLRKEKSLVILGQATRTKEIATTWENQKILLPLKELSQSGRDLKSIRRTMASINQFFWKPRVDQEVQGNRGYLKGSAPALWNVWEWDTRRSGKLTRGLFTAPSPGMGRMGPTPA